MRTSHRFLTTLGLAGAMPFLSAMLWAQDAPETPLPPPKLVPPTPKTTPTPPKRTPQFPESQTPPPAPQAKPKAPLNPPSFRKGPGELERTRLQILLPRTGPKLLAGESVTLALVGDEAATGAGTRQWEQRDFFTSWASVTATELARPFYYPGGIRDLFPPKGHLGKKSQSFGAEISWHRLIQPEATTLHGFRALSGPAFDHNPDAVFLWFSTEDEKEGLSAKESAQALEALVGLVRKRKADAVIMLPLPTSGLPLGESLALQSFRNQAIREMAQRINVPIFDPAPCLVQLAQSKAASTPSPLMGDHLSDDSQAAIGKALQEWLFAEPAALKEMPQTQAPVIPRLAVRWPDDLQTLGSEILLSPVITNTTAQALELRGAATWRGQSAAESVSLPDKTPQPLPLRFTLPPISHWRLDGPLSLTLKPNQGDPLTVTRPMEAVRHVKLGELIGLSPVNEATTGQAGFKATVEGNWLRLNITCAKAIPGAVEIQLDARPEAARGQIGYVGTLRYKWPDVDGNVSPARLTEGLFGEGYDRLLEKKYLQAKTVRSKDNGTRQMTISIPRTYFHLHEWQPGSIASTLGIDVTLIPKEKDGKPSKSQRLQLVPGRKPVCDPRRLAILNLGPSSMEPKWSARLH